MPLFETKKIDLPDGEWAEIRELSVPALKEADKKGTEEATELMRMLPETIVEKQMEKTRDQALQRIIRYEGYDAETMIKYGLTSWSFDEPCDNDHKAQLGAKQGEIVARAIFELSVLSSGEASRSSLRLVEADSPQNLSEPTTSTPSEEA